MPDLHEQITAAHQQIEQAELEARQLEARMRRIPGMERLLPARKFGQPVNIDAIKSNLTARSLINSYDEQLASFLGVQSGSARIAEERRVAREMAAEALRLRTERLRAENQQRQQQRERFANAGINQITGRRLGT